MRFIYYDTETTGISPAKDKITEIAAYDAGRDLTFSELVNPGMPIPLESSQITGITDDMVKDKPLFAEVGPRFLEFCEGDAVLIAHNNDAFDIKFLQNEFAFADIPFPEFKYIDTLKWARKYRPDLPRHALQYLREVYGLEANNAHRALDDVIMLRNLFSLMIDDLPPKTVYNLSQQKGPRLRKMPFGKHRGVALDKVPKSYLTWLASSGALDKPDNAELKDALSTII